MTAAATLTFPSGRTLTSWWRQLASHHPRRWWVGHLLFHRVEALIRLARPLPPFAVLVLRALALWPEAGDLDQRLSLDAQLLHRILQDLTQRGLAQAAGPMRWTLTDLGRQTLQAEVAVEHHDERRLFHFLNRGERAPCFVNLGDHAGQTCAAGDEWRFDPAALVACTQQSAAWKRQHGFPWDIEAILLPTPSGSNDPAGADWQRVIVDQPERLCTALIEAQSVEGPALLGFEVRPERWSLQPAAPVFTLLGPWQEALPELARGLPSTAWQQAWREWCELHGLGGTEAEACPLEHHGQRLRIHVPSTLMNRLRSMRSEALRGDAWLLAGEGPIRPAAQIEVTEVAGASLS
ncbi:MAG TPA: hypothetical protein VFA18_13115 [Gemmataceae bacterium]|nr:hypothetical protein [Gemmataceae bacterium]